MTIDLSVVEAKAGREGEFEQTFRGAWERLGKIPGLLRWRLERDAAKATRFVFYAAWTSRAELKALTTQGGYRSLVAAVSPLLNGAPKLLQGGTA